MQNKLRFLFLLLVTGTAVISATAANHPIRTSDLYGVNAREAFDKAHSAFENDPELFDESIAWLAAGVILLVIGTIVFLFSEINAVFVTRDSDFRTKLIVSQNVEKIDGPEFEELMKKETKIMAPRPYLSVIGVVLLMLGHSCLFYPLCGILRVVGLPSSPCVLLVTFGAFFAAVCVASFWMFLVWSCTRLFSSLIFLLVALSGAVMIPGGNPILLLIWVSLSFFAFYTYFTYLPTLYSHGDSPWWLQTVGEHDLDFSAARFSQALSQGGEILAMQVRDASESAKKASERLASQAAAAAQSASADAGASPVPQSPAKVATV